MMFWLRLKVKYCLLVNQSLNSEKGEAIHVLFQYFGLLTMSSVINRNIETNRHRLSFLGVVNLVCCEKLLIVNHSFLVKELDSALH